MSYDEVTPKLNQAYEGFNVSKDFERLAQSFSPLNVLHGKVQLMEGSETVLFQQIGAVETNYPLLLLNTINKLIKQLYWVKVFGDGV